MEAVFDVYVFMSSLRKAKARILCCIRAWYTVNCVLQYVSNL